jgi:hypothetical protein
MADNTVFILAKVFTYKPSRLYVREAFHISIQIVLVYIKD